MFIGVCKAGGMTIDSELQRDLASGAAVLSGRGLVGAFGHLSVRTSAEAFSMTPPRPLATVATEPDAVEVATTSHQAPSGAAGEVWMHWAVYRKREDVGAVCRAQPPAVAALAATGQGAEALHVLGALLGTVATHDDARLTRTPELGEAVATALGGANALMIHGNGALTVGRDLGEAVATMCALEESAQANLDALAAGARNPIPSQQAAELYELRTELLRRYWTYLRQVEHPTDPRT
jgi:HCOMODA/2-hydroxy-3-carboxy-muconic semialdehyde decarboxylase